MVERRVVGREDCLFIHDSAIHGQGLFSRRSFAPHEVISELHGDISLTPSRRSIQIAEDRHFHNPYVDYINHSCGPGSYISVGDDGSVKLVALRPIVRDVDEVTVNYNYTEYRVTHQFMCRCCATPTLIRGYRYVVLGRVERPGPLNEYTSSHLRDMAIAEFGSLVPHHRAVP